MDEEQEQEEWKLRSILLKEWLDNGGVEKILDVELIDDLIKVRHDQDGVMIRSTTTSGVQAFSLALLNASLHPPSFSGKDQTTYRSLFNKSIFIAPEPIETEERFDELWSEHVGKTDHLYRGQREAIWQLYTSGQRKWMEDRLHESEVSYTHFLLRLVRNSRTLHDGLLPKYFESIGMNVRSDIAVLSFLQHFGAPTPLQDWTWSFANAVFFALDKMTKTGEREADSYCSVYFILESGFSSAGLKDVFEAVWLESAPQLREHGRRYLIDAGFVSEADLDRQVDIGKADAGAKKKFATMFSTRVVNIENLMSEPRQMPLVYFSDRDDFPDLSYSLNNSLNIQNQRGAFIFNTHEALPVEQVGFQWHEADHGKDDSYRFCKCWNIHKKLEGHIRAKLDSAGIDKGFIYPDPSPMNFGMDPWEFAKEVYEQTRDEGRKGGATEKTKK